MITKSISSIESSDLDALVTNAVPEGKLLDYKRDLPGSADLDKKEFLADASSFANTAGGFLIFGVEETSGVPSAIVGVKTTDFDAEIRRLDGMLSAGIAPRMRYELRRVTHSSGADLLLLHVDRSWNGPHRVIFKAHDRFYARNSAGKYSLDVGELRDAFLSSSAIVDRIRDFHESQLIDIAAGRVPTPLKGGARLVVHLLPISAFASAAQLDISPMLAAPHTLPPMSARGWNHRITLEGLLTFAQVNTTSDAYVHLYRNGIVEAVDAYMLNQEVNGRRSIPSIAYEHRLIEGVKRYLAVQRSIGAAPPVYIMTTLLGARGCWLATRDEFYDLSDRYSIDRDVLDLPPIVLNDFEVDVASALKPALDAVWHSCGFPASLNFDAAGKWKHG